MTDVQLTREEWLAARPGASPEFEQARFGGDVPSAEQLAIDEINPFNSHLFREDRWQEHFARLRAEDPVHFNEMGSSGRYWSITTWQDVRDVEGDWESFSSAQGITLTIPPGTPLPDDTIPFDAFIAMDPPDQTDQRKTVRGISAPNSVQCTLTGPSLPHRGSAAIPVLHVALRSRPWRLWNDMRFRMSMQMLSSGTSWMALQTQRLL